MPKQTCIPQLLALGLSWDDARTLRRVSMTLHRWHELECGDGNNHGSWCITRGLKTREGFHHDDDGRPYLEHHHYLHGKGKDYVTYTPMADREKGALRRLLIVMSRHPSLAYYVQGDPRGCALYILRPGDVPDGADVSAYYSRGVAVYK